MSTIYFTFNNVCLNEYLKMSLDLKHSIRQARREKDKNKLRNYHCHYQFHKLYVKNYCNYIGYNYDEFLTVVNTLVNTD